MARGRLLVSRFRQWRANRAFSGSREYWENRYAAGGDSGEGSAGRLRSFKAEVVNRVIQENSIATVVELGCGDGGQLELFRVQDYIGLDVSATAIAHCRTRFAGTPGRRFRLVDDGPPPLAELALSMDVLLHLVEDDVFERYLRDLFAMATVLVVIYSTDHDDEAGLWPHNRHRRFTAWVDEHISGWYLDEVVPPPWPYDARRPNDTSDASFHLYRPVNG